MNNIELSAKISEYLKGSKTKAKKINELVAIHFNLLDVSENMYIEVKDGVISVMPYEYNDRQAAVTASTEVLDKLFSGALKIDEAISAGYVKIEGDVEKFKALAALIPVEKKSAVKTDKAPAAKKPAAKKAAPAKKEAAPKAEAKPVAKKAAPKAEKAEAKPAAKKTAAKK